MKAALGYYTDLMFLELDGCITEYPFGLQVESPNNPTYFFGNFLLLNQAPASKDLDILESKFKELFPGPKIKHFTFCWKGREKSDRSKFIEAGYEYDEVSILTLGQNELITSKNLNKDIDIQPFRTDEDWQKWVDLETEERDKNSHEESSYRVYMQGKVDMYQKLVSLNRGNYYGAFIGDEMVAAAGLFYKKEVGRFQSVLTKKAYRRQGICKKMIFEIAELYLTKLEFLVIAADDHYFAKTIYQQLGFKEREIQSNLCWWEKTKTKANKSIS